MARSRRKRRLLIVLGTLVGLIAVLVALLPTIANLGPGRGIVNRALAARVRGTVAVERLGLSWTGPQRVSGVRVTDEGGRKVADLDVALDAGLLALALGARNEFELTVGGSLTGDVRRDGSTSFEDLLAPDGGGGESGGSGPPPAVSVNFDRLAVNIDFVDGSARLPLVLDSVTGHARFAPGETLDVELRSTTTSGTLKGSIELQATADRLLDGRGLLRPRGAAVSGDLRLEMIPLPFEERVDAVLHRLDLTLRAPDLAKRVEMDVEGLAELAGAEPSRLKGRIVVDSPVTAGGAIGVTLDQIEGELHGERVPTAPLALFAPVLSTIGIDAARDLGPSLDLTAEVGRSGTAAQRRFTAALTSERLTARVEAAIGDDGGIEGNALEVTGTAPPTLLAALGGARMDRPARVNVALDTFRAPRWTPGETPALSSIAFTGRARIDGPTDVTLTARPGEAWTLHRVDLTFATASLTETLHVEGTALVDEGEITLDETLSDHLDAEGRPDLRRLIAVGSARVRGLDGGRIPPLLPAGVVADAAKETLAGPLDVSVRSERSGDGLAADLEIQGDGVLVQTTLVRRSDAIEVRPVRARVRMTAGLVSALVAAGATPVGDAAASGAAPAIRLVQPVDATIDVGGFTLPSDGSGGYGRPTEPIGAQVTIGGARLALEGVVEDADLGDLAADVSWSPADGKIDAHATLDRVTLEGTGVAKTVRLDGVTAGARSEGSEAPWQADVSVTGASLDGVEFTDAMTLGAIHATATIPHEGARTADVALETATITAPSLKEPLVVQGLRATLTAEKGPHASYGAQGTAALARGGGEHLAALRFDLDARRVDETLVPGGAVHFEEIAMAGVDALLGLEHGPAVRAAGETGSLTVKLPGEDASGDRGSRAGAFIIDGDLPRLRGEVRVGLDGDVLALTSDKLDIIVPHKLIDAVAEPSEEGGDAGTAGTTAPARTRRMRVMADVPMWATLATCRVPLPLVQGKPFDAAAVDVDATLEGGPIVFADESGEFARLENARVTLKSADLGQGVHFTVKGTTRARGVPDQGTVDVDGRLGNLLTDASRIGLGDVTVDGQATSSNISTVFVDLHVGLRGLLVAAVGPEMSSRVTAKGFSMRSGTMDVRVDTANGFLEGRVLGRGGDLHLPQEPMFHAVLDLTPPFRSQILAPISPVLADIDRAAQPVRLSVTSDAVIPIASGVDRLSGDFELLVGDVDFASEPHVLAVLALFDKRTKPVAGSISPIVGRIREGVVTYQPFTITIGQLPIEFSAGRVDLVHKTEEIHFTVPAGAVAKQFARNELAALTTLPFKIVGAGDKRRAELDLSAALESLGDALIHGGGGLMKGAGDIVDDLLKGKKKDQKK